MENYETAAAVIAKLRLRKGSIKGLCLDKRVENKKKVYALVCETLKLHAVVEAVVEKSNILKHEPKLGRDLAFVLIHDCLFAKRGIMCGGWAKAAVHRHRDALRAAVSCIAAEHNVTVGANTSRLALANQLVAAIASRTADASGTQNEAALPRYARVNTLQVSVEQAIAHFTEPRPPHGCGPGLDFKGHLCDWRSICPNEFFQDVHVPQVLVFHTSVTLHEDPLYLKGAIILQDKASCFPAAVLAPPLGSHCIDACAAPGNKTSHLAALLGNTGRITAFDLDARRLSTLRTLTARARCTNVDARHGNFLQVVPQDPEWQSVTHILVDPSCSGSGIVSRLDSLVDALQAAENGEDSAAKEARLASLAAFQLEMVLHAMKFPGAKRVSYSTCSVHAAENERVVAAVLESQTSFRLAPRSAVLPRWVHRGHTNAGLDPPDAEKVVRAAPEHGSNGFFVALFERTGDSFEFERQQECTEPSSTSEETGAKGDKTSSAETLPDAQNEIQTPSKVAKKKRKRRIQHRPITVQSSNNNKGPVVCSNQPRQDHEQESQTPEDLDSEQKHIKVAKKQRGHHRRKLTSVETEYASA